MRIFLRRRFIATGYERSSLRDGRCLPYAEAARNAWQISTQMRPSSEFVRLIQTQWGETHVATPLLFLFQLQSDRSVARYLLIKIGFFELKKCAFI